MTKLSIINKLKENISLLPFNTFGIDVNAKYFLEINSEEEIIEYTQNDSLNKLPLLILGGGSNILLTKDFDGIVLFNQIKGCEFTDLRHSKYMLSANSGENWHQIVLKSIEKGLSGIENLSLIPGSIGAAPMQNIGAYGVEIKDIFHSLEAIHLESGKKKTFSLTDCEFGYRESIFKKSEKGKWFITKVNFLLSSIPVINISYGAIQEVLNEKGIMTPTPKDVSNAVISIRESKLPNPKELGNSGSFFKNPEVSEGILSELKDAYPLIPYYSLPNHNFKIPAGWLIEQAGWKGKIVGNTGSHKNQSLVLVNYGNASGREVYELAKDIQTSIKKMFGIELEMEVNII